MPRGADRDPRRPFTVLHVCLGNICRSPMAERLLVARVNDLAGTSGEGLIRSHSVGTGDWHVGQDMDPNAAWQIRKHGGDPAGHAARTLAMDQLAESDLVLVATTEHADRILQIDSEAAPRTFLLKEFARLAQEVQSPLVLAADPATAPAPESTPPPFSPESVAVRGRAAVEAADALRMKNGLGRGGNGLATKDDVDDPWGGGEAHFVRVADDINGAVLVIAAALLGKKL